MSDNIFITRKHKRNKRIKRLLLFSIIVLIAASFIIFDLPGKINSYLIKAKNQETITKISSEYIVDNPMINIEENNETDELNEEIEEVVNSDPEEIIEEEIESEAPPNDDTSLDRAYLNVPFTPQAPFANWDQLHENACEEAAILQVQYYLTQKNPPPEEIDNDIKDLVNWQIENFGSHHDIYAEEVKSLIIKYYNYSEDQVTIVQDVTIQEIKDFIAQGYPVIAPITGHLLKNPYYHHPGYHMLTIIGYTEERFITNDVGTRRGKDFSYEYDRFMNAMQDASGDVVVIIP